MASATPRFGTDGVRGVANAELTPEFVLALGRAAARVLGGPRFLIARDTRASGPLLQAALTAGIAAEGVDVVDLGVLPTPAAAALSAADGVPAAVISASHNPFGDNGIKLFASGGRKLGVEVEAALSSVLDDLVGKGATRSSPARREPSGSMMGGPGPAADGPVPGRSVMGGPGVAGAGLVPVGSVMGGPGPAADGPVPVGSAVGRAGVDAGSQERYLRSVLDSLEGRRLTGLRVVLDCANGAAWATGPELVRRAGADLAAVLADTPDGTNINDDCGSTYPRSLQEAVRAHRADVGLALDGDADRVIAVDHTGAVVDGDQMIAALALDRMARGCLKGSTVVVTVMTNLGFHLAMAEQGIAVHTTPVGDRHVLEALDRGGWSLGGEQSGHVIFPELATTGDGILTGLQLLDALARSGMSLADLAGSAMERLPQVLRNVRVVHTERLAGASPVWDEVKVVEAGFGGRGRVVVRGSGTEPLVRVMVEAPTTSQAEDAAARLVECVVRHLG